jgi:hypothetical protein
MDDSVGRTTKDNPFAVRNETSARHRERDEIAWDQSAAGIDYHGGNCFARFGTRWNHCHYGAGA